MTLDYPTLDYSKDGLSYNRFRQNAQKIVVFGASKHGFFVQIYKIVTRGLTSGENWFKLGLPS